MSFRPRASRVDAQPEFVYGWRAGVSVTVPLFTTHRAGVLVEQTTLEQLLAQRQAAVARIEGQVTAAAVSAEAQRQLYVRYRDQIVPQAQQVEQVAQDAYQLGQTGIVPLLQALQATREVRLRAIDAASSYQTAHRRSRAGGRSAAAMMLMRVGTVSPPQRSSPCSPPAAAIRRRKKSRAARSFR